MPFSGTEGTPKGPLGSPMVLEDVSPSFELTQSNGTGRLVRSRRSSPPVADSRQRRQTGREARQERGIRFQAAQAEEGVSV